MPLAFSIKKSFEGFSLDLSLTMGEELMVLFGPSGAGKSLTLKMISGLMTPDEGEVVIGGRRVFDPSRGVNVPIRERRVGYLFQDYALFPHMTVEENISYGIRGRGGGGGGSGRGGGGAGDKVKRLLELMRLAGLESRYPHELSGGQKQRTALARTLAVDPEILLLDEPFSALDYQVREKLRADLVNIHRVYPVPTVVVTHDLEEAFMLGDRISVVNEGRIEQVGSREDVFYRPGTRNVARFVGVRNIFDGVVIDSAGPDIVLRNPGLGEVKAARAPGLRLEEGANVTFCIRPEEIPVIRSGKALEGKVKENLVEGSIASITGRGTTQILFIRTDSGDTTLKVEVPNFVLRKLGLATGKRITVSLKKESVWIIP